MQNFAELIQGKRTYIIACATILFGILGLITGNLPQDQALVIILNGLGLGTLRAGVEKNK